MNEDDLIPALFSFNTEHWIKVEINGKEYAFKYIPLSIREKVNISRRIEFAIEDKDAQLNSKMIEFAREMLRKAYGSELDVECMPSTILIPIYQAILLDTANRKMSLDKFYLENKTEKLGRDDYRKPSKLDGLVSLCVSMKDSNLNLGQLSDLDETSLFCLMIFSNEMIVRENNALEEAKARSK